MVIGNKKAVIKTLGLVILLFGVASGSALMYQYVAGGVKARSDFQRKSLERINDLEGMEIFYEEMMRHASQEALADGYLEPHYRKNEFCPNGFYHSEGVEGNITYYGEEWVKK